MPAFITDDFHDSVWTNQEVGYAMGKDVPIITVKFERKDPSGFIGAKQALKGYDLNRVEEAAPAIYKLLIEKLGQESRLRRTLISTFLTSPNFNETRERFDRLNQAVSSLSDAEVEQIQEAFSSNEALRDAYYLGYSDRLIRFMERCTGRQFEIDKKRLLAKKKAPCPVSGMDDEIPF